MAIVVSAAAVRPTHWGVGMFFVRYLGVFPVRVSLLVVLLLLSFSATAASSPRGFAGLIYPLEERALSLAASGLVTILDVKEGDVVSQGQRLLQLDSRVQALEVQRRRLLWQDGAEVQMLTERSAIINEQYQTLSALYADSRSVSRDELNAVRLEQLQTQAQLELAQVQKAREKVELALSEALLADLALQAPMAGVVTRVAVKNGEWAAAGEPVLELMALAETQLRLSVPDSVARQLVLAQKISVQVDGLGRREGSLDYIAPVADPASGLVEIRIGLDNADLAIRPGTRAQFEL